MCKRERECVRERERERQRQRQTDRQTETETERQRQTETDRQTETETETKRERERDRQTDRQTDRDRDRAVHNESGETHINTYASVTTVLNSAVHTAAYPRDYMCVYIYMYGRIRFKMGTQQDMCGRPRMEAGSCASRSRLFLVQTCPHSYTHGLRYMKVHGYTRLSGR